MCSGNKFNVEVGIHNNIERIDIVNFVHVVEDEFHVMLICPMYLSLRNNVFRGRGYNE